MPLHGAIALAGNASAGQESRARRSAALVPGRRRSPSRQSCRVTWPGTGQSDWQAGGSIVRDARLYLANPICSSRRKTSGHWSRSRPPRSRSGSHAGRRAGSRERTPHSGERSSSLNRALAAALSCRDLTWQGALSDIRPRPERNRRQGRDRGNGARAPRLSLPAALPIAQAQCSALLWTLLAPFTPPASGHSVRRGCGCRC